MEERGEQVGLQSLLLSIAEHRRYMSGNDTVTWCKPCASKADLMLKGVRRPNCVRFDVDAEKWLGLPESREEHRAKMRDLLFGTDQKEERNDRRDHDSTRP